MEQLSLPHMPTRLFACTPSRLAAFECPRRYRFAYLDRPPPSRGQPWAHHAVGATAHLALARWWTLPRRSRTPQAGAQLVERNWQALGFRDEAQSAGARARTAQWVCGYLAERVDADDRPVGVERTVAAVSARLAVSGRVDRIDRDGDHAVVVDYKTGRRGVTADDAAASQALALYVLGVRRTLRRPCRRVELHHLPTNTVVAFEHSDETLRQNVERAERAAAAILAATQQVASGADPDRAFPALPSSACSWCDFRAHCPEGRRAVPAADPWAGLPEWAGT